MKTCGEKLPAPVPYLDLNLYVNTFLGGAHFQTRLIHASTIIP
jgi:hypothetical protein